MQFLTFFVFDATLFCLLFVNDLRRVQTLWPAATTEIYDGRLRMQTNLVQEWIDLDFVAKRTNCIGSLIYFPFVLIALLIVSRSTIFANYAPSLTILLMQGLSLVVVFTCAIMLCWAAKNVRDTTRKNLTDGIIHAKDTRGTAMARSWKACWGRSRSPQGWRLWFFHAAIARQGSAGQHLSRRECFLAFEAGPASAAIAQPRPASRVGTPIVAQCGF